MGKKNPLKQVMTAASQLTFDPISRIARQAGATGIADGVDKFKNAETALGHGTVDLANNEKDKQKKKERAFTDAESVKQQAATASAATAAAAAEHDRIENERMSGGTASRTLLTGPAGLDDEEKSISRRTLAGR